MRGKTRKMRKCLKRSWHAADRPRDELRYPRASTCTRGVLQNIVPCSTYWCILASMNKSRMNVYLNGAQKKTLEKLSAKTGAPVAELIRRAIDKYLQERAREIK
jgi:Ribbon-helix-helix domain